MALSAPELAILQYHAKGYPNIWDPNYDPVNDPPNAIPHHAVKKMGNDYTAITAWYADSPTGALKDLSCLLPAWDRHHYFKHSSFTDWYAELCKSIAEDTTIKIFGLTNDQINDLSLDLLGQIIDHDLSGHTMQSLIQELMKHGFSTELDLILKCLAANGQFNQHTIFALNIDLNNDNSRWQNLGLSAAPTETEIQTIMTT